MQKSAAALLLLMTGSLFGGETVHTTKFLHAGPISVKFEDGELRYLRAGGKEIVRRIFFAVRDKNWNTPMPEFSQMVVSDSGDGFVVTLAARCKCEDAEYVWSATITGTKDGRIVFDAEGEPLIDTKSNRIGLCTLFGTESLIGQNFETIDAQGKATPSTFPEFVWPELVAKKFQTLQYTTAEGMKVVCKLEGATYDMEDQRNWGDTSFKAFAPLKYSYPNVKKGQHEHETITLEVTGAPETKSPAADAILIRIGKKAIEGAKVPASVAFDDTQKSIGFVEANMNRKKFTGTTSYTFSYTPFSHLPDDDTMMENARAVWHQARSARQFTPNAVLRFAPIRLQFGGAKSDPRNGAQIEAAWAAVIVKYLSLGGVNEMGFSAGPGPVDAVLKSLAASAGKPLIETEVKPAESGVEAFTVEDADGTALWLVNTTPEKRTVRAEETGPAGKVNLIRSAITDEDIKDGHVVLTLLPYGVCRILLGK